MIYQQGHCTFINENSLTTKFFEERNLFKSADLVIIDPPFNIADKGKVTKTHGKIYSNKAAWGDDFRDSFTRPEYDDLIRTFCQRAFSLLTDGGSFFCFIDRKYSGVLADIGESCGFLYKNMVAFIKANCVPKVRAYNFGSAFEVGLWFIKPNSGRTPKGNRVAPTRPRIFNNEKPVPNCRFPNTKFHNIKQYHNSHSSNVFIGPIGSKRTGHATEKYTWQLEPIIKTLSKSNKQGGGHVLDLCSGGFNSGLVCQELSRSYIGIELDQYFWEKGVGLLKDLIAHNKPGPWKPNKKLKIQPKEKR